MATRQGGLAEPIRLAGLRRAARGLMAELQRMAGLPFEELPAEEAGRLRDRLHGGWMGARARAVERLGVRVRHPLSLRSALRLIAALALATFSAVALTVLLVRQAEDIGILIPAMGILSVMIGASFFLIGRSADRARRVLSAWGSLDSGTLNEAEAPDLPWAAALAGAAAVPGTVLLTALLGGTPDGGFLAFLLACLVPAALLIGIALLVSG